MDYLLGADHPRILSVSLFGPVAVLSDQHPWAGIVIRCHSHQPFSSISLSPGQIRVAKGAQAVCNTIPVRSNDSAPTFSLPYFIGK